MTSPTLVRLIAIVLSACALLFLMSYRIGDPSGDPLLNIKSNITEALNPITRNEQKVDKVTRALIEQVYGKLPMRFEANQGQTDARVKFKARGAGYAVFLTSDEAVLQLRQAKADQPVKSAALRMKLIGSNRSSSVSGIEKLPTTSNYFIGNDPAKWRREIANYTGVRYDSVYPGIDLVWYGNQQRLEHDFLIAPGADPGLVKISFWGTDAMSIDGEGALVLRAGGEDLRLLKPLAYQESNGERRTVACDYRLGQEDQVEFRLGDYDPKLPLVIDPVLVYSTYIGGIGIDAIFDIAVDGEGAAYIAGRTDSADFPGPSPIQQARGTQGEAYVLKINPEGSAIVFGTWIGGSGIDYANSVSVDRDGNVYLAGDTTSLDFPLQNSPQTSLRGASDAFALKIDSSGSMLVYSTYIGGLGQEGATALAVDGGSNVYLTGFTNSADFPVVNAFQPARSGSGSGVGSTTDAFIAKLDPTGSSFVYSSYLGGSASDSGTAIDVDTTGAAYVTGDTSSMNFPVVNAFQATPAGQIDAFVARVDPSGTALSWATYLGGSDFDIVKGIAVNGSGDAYVAGLTSSSNFPINNAIQPSFRGSQDGFITRLKSDGSALDFSTYLGGTAFDQIYAIAVDSAGNTYVTGSTTSLDFPVVNAVQSTKNGDPSIGHSDVFVTKLNPQGSAIVYSTYLGGDVSDQGNSIAVDATGNAYVTGTAFSGDFPTTPSPIRSAGPSDSFVTKIGLRADLAVTLNSAPDPVMINNQLPYSLIVTNHGPDPAINVKVKDSLPAGAELESIVTSKGSCLGTREIVCTLGDLAAGSGAQITIVVRPSRKGMLANLATVTSESPDIVPANNMAAIETNVSYLPSIYGRITTTGGAGLSGVSVVVDGSGRAPALTADDGNYQVSELTGRNRDYTITPSLPGYVFTPPSRSIENMQGDQRVDFGAVACNFTISPASLTIPAAGGSGTVTIASPDPRCAWTATSNVPWIRFISAPAGTGSGTLTFAVEPATVARNGVITIGGKRFVVVQEFNACDTVTFNNAKILMLNFEPAPDTTIFADDFNNDSVSDLVFTVFHPVHGLRISLSNSNGGYEDSSVIYPGLTQTVRASDLNNDGARDLAVITTEFNERLLVFTGDGAGGFSAPIELEAGPDLTGLAIADFNSDGISDLAVGSILSTEIGIASYNLEIHPGDGGGGFTAPIKIGFTTSEFFAYPLQIETGDFNGDGISDLAVKPSFGSPIIFTGDGTAGFTLSNLTNFGMGGQIALGDFNGDLKTDLAISPPGFSTLPTILIWISTPAGSLQSAPSLNIDGRLLFAADFNMDGKSDLLLQRSSDLAVLSAIGDGQFADPIRYIPGGSPAAVTLADFKRDGSNLRTDLLVIFPPPNRRQLVAVLTSGPDGFDAPRAFNYRPPNVFNEAAIGDMESGDLNGDGKLDLVISDSVFSDAFIMFGNGHGEFGPPVIIDDGVNFGRPRAIELRDFNNDGISDLAFLFDSSQKIVILFGNGQDGFTRATELSTGIDPRDMMAADFNNDGNLDLVAEAQSGGLALFLGNGLGGFTESAAGIGGNLASILFTTGDFNGDGNADIAYCDILQNPTTEGLKVLFGNGQGGFAEHIDVRTDFNVGFISVADFNLDGRDDLAYTPSPSRFDSPVFVVLSNSEGGFTAPVRYQAGQGVSNILSNDMNGDDKLDLIVVADRDSSVSLLLGDGDGSFNQAVSYRIIESPSVIKTGDFDENGTTDIAFVQSGFPVVGILLNRSICGPPEQ
jgi:uncharacterized repeat protein (TIGR01451 family)